jgi:hypothetical protein
LVESSDIFRSRVDIAQGDQVFGHALLELCYPRLRGLWFHGNTIRRERHAKGGRRAKQLFNYQCS